MSGDNSQEKESDTTLIARDIRDLDVGNGDEKGKSQSYIRQQAVVPRGQTNVFVDHRRTGDGSKQKYDNVQANEEPFRKLTQTWQLPEAQHMYTPAEFQSVQMKQQSVERESMLFYKNCYDYLRDQLEKARNEALYRQSQEFEAQVTDGNPAIIVLNDKNSPNEIGMEFDNLYNSQFVEALGEFKEQGFNKRKTIPEFLHILKTAFQFCRDTATNQLERMKQFVIDPFSVEVSEIQPQNIDTSKLPKRIIKQLKDARKTMALYTTETVCEKFNKKLDSSGVFVKLKSHEKTDMFIRKCVQLCWLMSIQDPPLSLCFHCPEKKFVDKDVFRTYTRPGNIFEYMVWPALMLSENGPVIKRGIVQVKK